MRGIRNTDRNVRKFITIKDVGLWEKIDRLMTLPEYEKSFNKVINDALFYGLEELCHRLFSEDTETTERQAEEPNVKRMDGINEDYFSEVVKLLKEIILNETINKSILCSLFEARNLELNGERVSGKNFKEGKFRDTPAYLTKYELRALRDLRK